MKTTVLEGDGIKYVMLQINAAALELIRYPNNFGRITALSEITDKAGFFIEDSDCGRIQLTTIRGIHAVSCDENNKILLSPEEYAELCKQFPEWVR